MAVDMPQNDRSTNPPPAEVYLVPTAGWRPPPEAGRAILRAVLTAHERRAAA